MKRITWIFLFSLFLSQTVSAKIITVHFSGNVDTVNGTSIYSPGDAVDGTFVIDDGMLETTVLPDHAEYRMLSPLLVQRGFTNLKVGNETFYPNVEGSDASVFIANNIYSGPDFTIDDLSFDSCCQVGTFSNGDFVENMHIIFNDDSNNPLSSNDLEDGLANLSVFKNKDMGINGRSQGGDYYYLQVKITSISVDGISASIGPDNLVAFDSVVTEINDSTGQIRSLIKEGETVSGNFTFNPDLVDIIPFDPKFSIYESLGNTENNITINFAGEKITSDLNSDFKIEIENNVPNMTLTTPDRFNVSATMLNPVPLMNGVVIEEIRIEFINPPAQNISSTELLSSTPSDLSKWYVSNLYINGRNPGGSFFNIKAALSDLVQGASSVSPMQTEELFPASGITQMHHNFDGIILFDSNRAPITQVYSTLINARDYIHNRCNFDGSTMMNQQRIVCHNISYDLVPGMNVIRIAVHFADGTKKYYLNRWNVIE